MTGWASSAPRERAWAREDLAEGTSMVQTKEVTACMGAGASGELGMRGWLLAIWQLVSMVRLCDEAYVDDIACLAEPDRPELSNHDDGKTEGCVSSYRWKQ